MARALVSGASGFVGSHLVPRLLAEGHEVLRVDRTLGDDVNKMTETVLEFQPSVCFHLATHFIAQHKPDDIDPLIEANLAFGTRLLDACSKLDDIAFVNVGTIWQHYNSRPYSPVSLYAATKQAFVDLIRYYTDCTSLRAVTVELSDTYGPSDKRRKLVQLLIERSLSGEELNMSPGEQYISLLHVDDAVDALAQAPELATHEAPAYSVPSTETLTLKELVQRVNQVTGRKVNVTFGATPYRPREMMSPWKATPPLPNWMPQIGLDQGLKQLLEASQ